MLAGYLLDTILHLYLFEKSFCVFQQFLACTVHLRNEFNFWNVHGIMNTSGLLQIKVKCKGLHVNFARDPEFS